MRMDNETLPPADEGPVQRTVRPHAPTLERWGRGPEGTPHLLQRLPDGYWTPWHVAEAALTEARELADNEGTRAVQYLRRARKAEAALLALANAADGVGVLHFDGDDMPPEVQSMQAATVAAREVLGLCKKCGLPPGCPDCCAVHDVGLGA